MSILPIFFNSSSTATTAEVVVAWTFTGIAALAALALVAGLVVIIIREHR